MSHGLAQCDALMGIWLHQARDEIPGLGRNEGGHRRPREADRPSPCVVSDDSAKVKDGGAVEMTAAERQELLDSNQIDVLLHRYAIAAIEARIMSI